MPDDPLSLEHRVLVGTHHKTGTRWLHKIFAAIAERHGLMLYAGEPSGVPPHAAIVFSDHSRFDFDRIGDGWRGVHMIRDPRDVVVSGCHYHRTAREPWLRASREAFGGLSYQEAINALATDEDRLRFEMEHTALETARAMRAWDYGQPGFFEMKYEDAIADAEMRPFREMFGFLGFPESAIPRLVEIVREHSLFSGRAPKDPHVRSGRPGQWRSAFTPGLRRRFAELTGDTLVVLGYERDDGWIETGPDPAG